MPTSYGALCSDFYVNQKLTLKMDLPKERETVLHYFDSVKKAQPQLDTFRRYEQELLLESGRDDAQYQWASLRRTSVRSGFVNPDSMDQAYQLHRHLLQTAPFHLTISPLDIDYLELTFGFDLECGGNHDQVVYDALYADSPLGSLVDIEHAKLTDVQPMFGLTLSDDGQRQAYFDVKTRHRTRRGSTRAHRDEPISLFLTMRQYGPLTQIDELIDIQQQLTEACEQLANEKLVPDLLTPIAQHITPATGNGPPGTSA